MKKRISVLFLLSLFTLSKLHSQRIKFEKSKLEAVNVLMSAEKFMGKKSIKVVKDSSIKKVDEPTYVKLKDLDFKNGTIEVKVYSILLKNAPETARGFIGVAFRINDDNSRFESIYIRPTNGRAENQLRRNRSIQYFSYPDYKFDRLRSEAPGEYESYTDMGLNEWIRLIITVKDNQAKLFINNNVQPSLIVNDLKNGTGTTGAIGLWVDIGTEGYFADLKIKKDE